MAGTGLGNPAGYVPFLDGGAPRIVGGVARNAIISGGVLCFASGATGVVSSGANSVATGDILFAGDASGGQFNGVCIQTTDVSGNMAIATRGTLLLTCNGSVEPGMKVACDGNNAVSSEPFMSTGSPGVYQVFHHSIGRALTAGASGGYALIDVHG